MRRLTVWVWRSTGVTGLTNIHRRHGVTVEQANEALTDLHALVFAPDYASLSGHSVRAIGWSDTAGRLLTA